MREGLREQTQAITRMFPATTSRPVVDSPSIGHWPNVTGAPPSRARDEDASRRMLMTVLRHHCLHAQ